MRAASWAGRPGSCSDYDHQGLSTVTIVEGATRPAKQLVTIPVAGMTCVACERRIAKALTKLPGVISATASARKGTASLIITAEASQESVNKTLTALGYNVGRSSWINRDPAVWRSAGIAAVFVAILLWVVGAGDLTSRLGDLSKGGLLLVFALGLAAGVSTCMAMVGGIVLAISAHAAGRSGANNGSATTDAGTAARTSGARTSGAARGSGVRSSVVRTNLVFQGGRIGGFGLLGLALGAIGQSAAMPKPVVVVLMTAVALTMLLVGVRLTELSPRAAGWSPTMPAALGSLLGLTGDVPARRTAGTALAGAATFFLPCGFTQAVQLYAFSTGSPKSAGLIMAAFALGTAPALFAVAGAPTLFKGTKKVAMLRALGVVVIGFAFINGTSAMRLAGVNVSDLISSSNAPPTISANVTVTPVSQTATTEQHGSGYEPGETVIYAGRPTKWVITSTAPYSCAASITSADLGIEGRLAEGPNVVELPKLAAGTYNFSCSMGMYSGRIVVIAPPAPVPPG
jgi:sulfite exporter TauE/SafE/copper chaperone CopZ